MKIGSGFALVLWLALAGVAHAEPVTSVIELFTSQGCSSCPPADKLLGEIARGPKVLALSFPVDYWDYIGWKDTFAKPAYTARQKAYASVRGDGEVYTPQAVINGTRHGIGADEALLRDAAAAEPGLRLSVRIEGGRVSIGPGQGSGSVWQLRIARSRVVPIGRGENSGRTLTYTNIVRDMSRLGEWNGSEVSFALPATASDDADGYAILVQGGAPGRPGPIYGAAKSEGL